jgi:hypothetical protein
MGLTAVYFDNFNYFRDTLSEESMNIFREETKDIQNNFGSLTTNNNTLAGNIAREYYLDEEANNKIESLLLPYAKSYCESNPGVFSKPVDYSKLKLKSSWANFQSKYEFNPPHTHTGLISFVVWVKIPYSREDELQNNSVRYSNCPLAGSFQFLYSDILGRVSPHIIHCDKSMENTLLMFPAALNHAVYPFYTSDEYRITVSGNFFEDV